MELKIIKTNGFFNRKAFEAKLVNATIFFLHAVKRDTAGIRIKSYDFRSGQPKDYKKWYSQLSWLTFSVKKKSVKSQPCMVER